MDVTSLYDRVVPGEGCRVRVSEPLVLCPKTSTEGEDKGRGPV